MSTRCQVIVADPTKENPEALHDAIVYRHSDGYPDSEHGVLHDLLPLVKAFTANRGHDPMYLTAHIVAEFIRLGHKQTDDMIRSLKRRYKKRGETFTADDEKSYSSGRFLGHGVEAFTGQFHGDLAYVYIVHKDHVEVLKTVKGFWDDSTLKNTKLVKRVKFDGTRFRKPSVRKPKAKPLTADEQAISEKLDGMIRGGQLGRTAKPKTDAK